MSNSVFFFHFHFTGVGVQDTEKKKKEKVAPTGISQCGWLPPPQVRLLVPRVFLQTKYLSDTPSTQMKNGGRLGGSSKTFLRYKTPRKRVNTRSFVQK